jgi:hypothetical protein
MQILTNKALIIAKLNSYLWGDILQSVCHIIFFGTPHHGTISVVNFVRRIGSSALRAKPDSVLRELELWSGPSMQVNANFVGGVKDHFTWTSVVENEDTFPGIRVSDRIYLLLQSNL